MAGITFNVGFSGASANPFVNPIVSGLRLTADGGPDSITVTWGSTFDGPLRETLFPGAPGEAIGAPGGSDFRDYLDGTWRILVVADFGGTSVSERLEVFLARNTTTDMSYFGSLRDDLIATGSGNDFINGGQGDDWIFGNDGNDRILGGLGNDLIGGGDGNDNIDGGEGNDFLIGDDGDDVLRGGNGNDFLDGSDGEDRLFGGLGADTFQASRGKDRMVTDADQDRDVFRWEQQGLGTDLITGFETGFDKIELLILDGATLDDTRLVGSAADMTDPFTWIIYEQATGRLIVDTNGTQAGGAEVLARFVDTPVLTFDDFWFA